MNFLNVLFNQLFETNSKKVEQSDLVSHHFFFLWIICRERSDLLATVTMLRSTISNLQQREADALRQVQQSVEVAEQAQLERVQVLFQSSNIFIKNV